MSDKQDAESRKEPRPWLKFVAGFGVMLAIIVGAFCLFSWALPKFVLVEGRSMSPTLQDGNLTVCFSATSYERNCIYVLEGPDNLGLVMKRLVGVPGDTIDLVDGATYCNSILVSEAPGDSWDNATFALGEDEYFFLGDNRRESYDGRYWSEYIHAKDIRYKVVYVFTPSLSLKEVR